jgi:hypothetical protein
VGYCAEKSSVKWDTVHCISFCCGVGYNGRKIPALWDTTENIFLAVQRLFAIVSHSGKISSFVSHNRGKPSPLYPTTEKNSSFVSHNRKKPLPLYPTTAKKLNT